MEFNPYSGANFQVVASEEEIPSMGSQSFAQHHPLEIKYKSWCSGVSFSSNIYHSDLKVALHPPLSPVKRFPLSLVKAILGSHRQLREHWK